MNSQKWRQNALFVSIPLSGAAYLALGEGQPTRHLHVPGLVTVQIHDLQGLISVDGHLVGLLIQGEGLADVIRLRCRVALEDRALPGPVAAHGLQGQVQALSGQVFGHELQDKGA